MNEPFVSLENLSIDQLRQLEQDVAVEIKRRLSKEKLNAKKQILELASAHHINLANLTKTSNSPQYRNPDNQFETWGGRGRKPKWLLDAMAAGKSLDELKID